MKITYIVTECRDKVSKNCTQTFNREVKRGRPQVNCDACKAEKTVKPTGVVITDTGPVLERVCPCGNKFTINPGRGRKASKCDDCRAAGTVYRENADGEIETVEAARLAEEQRERAEAEGRKRADNLFNLMAPLLEKRNRQVIVH